MSDAVKWGILGCAGIAERALIPAIRSSATGELAGIASRDERKARDWAERFGIPRAYKNYADLLKDPAIEAVYIPLANHLHRPWSIRALKAGKHVLCEKPIALSAREARAMAAAAGRSGRLLMEAFMYRFHPQIERALELVRTGEIGEVRFLRSSFTFTYAGDPFNYHWYPRMGGGSLLDVGCYPLSAARLVFGAEPLSVYARGRFHPRRRVDMSVSALLEFPGGGWALLDSSYETQFQSRIEIAGSRGRIEIPRAFSQKSLAVEIRLVKGEEETILSIPAANAFVRMVDHFGNSLRQNRPLRCDGRDAVLNMKTIDAVFGSIRSGRAVRLSAR
ncbi:MAG: Gfo/Idh/MocA family oxidoreductase [Candidatus Aminicenantes bacterium]|nr:Gfo/Idh/MocA family oxidoreductase [Candidatus Aminicenantes bacterium]